MSEHKGKLRRGQLFDQEDNLVIPYSEQIVNTDNPQAQECEQQGDTATEITPEDAQSYRVRVFDLPTEALDAYSLSVPATTDLDLPDELLSIATTFNNAFGAGSHDQDGDGVSISSSPSLNLALNSKANASASVMPDIQPVIRQKWARNVPCMHYFFYINGDYDMADVLTRLGTITGSTVNAWPKFQPRIAVFTLKGETFNISVDADVQQYASLRAGEVSVTYTWGEGEGVSREVSTTTKTVVIPPTIHGAITLTPNTDSAAGAASASSGWSAATNWPARSAASSATATANASITPTSLAATSPAAIPTSGLYLHRLRSESYKWGYNRVFAEVVDFADV